METVRSEKTIKTYVEDVRYPKPNDPSVEDYAGEYGISSEAAKFLCLIFDLQDAIKKDLRDIWERLDAIDRFEVKMK